MNDPIAVAKLEAFHGHEHPTLDIGRLEHERTVLDDGFEVCFEIFEYQIEIGF
jgi:hypothetical protein